MIRHNVVEEFFEERSVLILNSSGEIQKVKESSLAGVFVVDLKNCDGKPVLPQGFVFVLGRRFNEQHAYEYFYQVTKPNVVQHTRLLSHAKAFLRIELAVRFGLFWERVSDGPSVQILTRQITKPEAQEFQPHWITKRTLIRRTDFISITSSLPRFLPRQKNPEDR